MIQPAGFVLRPARPTDASGIVEIHNRQEANGPPLSVDLWRAAMATDSKSEHYVVERAGRVVATAHFSHAWWTGQSNVYSVELRVDASVRRQGVGRGLFDVLRTSLMEQGAERLLAWVRQDAVDARRFVAARGFAETRQVIDDYVLQIQEANLKGADDALRRIETAGMVIQPLAELNADSSFLAALQRLWGSDSEDQSQSGSADTFRRQVLEGPGNSAETLWVALDGTRPVGMTFLKHLTSAAAENDYTVVDPAYRGRGLGRALKIRSILWARRNGVAAFYTSSETGNAAMIAVNTVLGYKRGARRLEVGLDLGPDSGTVRP